MDCCHTYKLSEEVMLFTQLEQLKKWILVLSFLLFALTGQSAYAASQSVQTKLMTHKDSSGGQGEDVFALKKPEKLPAKACVAFVDASVEYQKRRFGKAKIEKKPAKGCDPAKAVCKLTVGWNHAPAGALSYQLNVQWNVKKSGC